VDQQQVHAIVHAIETIVVLDVLQRKQLVRLGNASTITLQPIFNGSMTLRILTSETSDSAVSYVLEMDLEYL